MYFTAALSNNGDNRDVDIIKSFVGRVSLTLTTCSFASASPKEFRKTLLLRDRREFVSPEPPNRRDWRSQVTNTFLQNSQTAHDAMLRQVEEVCFDLERRCYDVEGPLRCAEDDRNKKVLEVEQLRQQNESLELSCRQSAQSISDLRQEMTRLEEQAEGTYHRAEELSSLLKSARDELREQQTLSAENLRNEKDKSRSRELDLIATSTEKDDRIEEIQEELRHMQSENERIQQSLDTEIKEKTSSSDTIAFLQADIQENKKLAEKYKVLYSQKEEEARKMSETTRALEMENEKMKAMVSSLLPVTCKYKLIFSA